MHQSFGFGLGLRPDHYSAILAETPRVDWFEAITENYLIAGGRPLHHLERIRATHPVALHGVSLSIGGSDPLDRDYLRKLRALSERVEPIWISDHLCWTGVDGLNLHDLLPLPYTDEALAHVAGRVRQVQDILGRRILLENVSSYVEYTEAAMPEPQFLAEVARRSGCGILLDVNNVYVAARNHGFDPWGYLRAIPRGIVDEIHLAGHVCNRFDGGELLIDTHSRPVADPVWALYRAALKRFGPVPTLIEWDADLPPLQTLLVEAYTADSMLAEMARPELHDEVCDALAA